MYKNATLTFDPENRLTQFGTTLSNGYTAEGLRAWKRSAVGNSTVQPNYYLYDGDDPICELDGSDGSFKRVNTWGANGLVSRITKASSTGYYTYDPQGNLCQLLNGGAGVSVTYHTDAFGNVTSSNGSGATFAFGAQWGYSADSETGFVLCGHRFYDPTNGRWITRDPISYDGGINLYGYVGNNPVNNDDSQGLAKSYKDYEKMSCPALLLLLNNLNAALQDKLSKYNPEEDNMGGHPTGYGGITSPGRHYIIIRELEAQIQLVMKVYRDNCGTPPAPPVPFPIRVPAPRPYPPMLPPLYFNPKPGPNWGNNGNTSCHANDGYGGPPNRYHM